MQNSHGIIIISDLDGCLLDHHSYRFEPACPALARLRANAIPLVLNSSKTAAEIGDIRAALGVEDPYAVENGSALIIPRVERGTEVMRLGVERARILDELANIRRQTAYRFTSFADMRVAEVMAATGLSEAEALRAMRREYSEPLLWDGSQAELEDFSRRLRQVGLQLSAGGRFLHVCGPADKGTATALVRDYYADAWHRAPKLIALGDGANDLPMLRRADIAFLIRSPVNRLPDGIEDSFMISQDTGPVGWNACVMGILDRLGLTR